jgi:hypothetical protein
MQTLRRPLAHVLRFGAGLVRDIRGREFVALEIEFERLVVEHLLVRSLGEDQAERVLEDGAVGKADEIQGAGGIDAFGR